MRRSLFEIYTLLICFLSLIGLVVSLFWLLYGIMAWTEPTLMVSSYTYAAHQTNDRYLERYGRSYAFGRSDTGNSVPRPSEHEITKSRLSSYETEITGEARGGKKTCVFAGFWLTVSAILFCIHWRLEQRIRDTSNQPEPTTTKDYKATLAESDGAVRADR